MRSASQAPVIAVLNGPNLNLLGVRQPEIYGRESLGDIEAMCRHHLQEKGFSLRFVQENGEGALVDRVHGARDCAAVLINAAGYTHSSVALLDALLTLEAPVIEVHLSHPAKREPFRHHSVIAPACRGVIAGFGAQSYRLALDAALALLDAEGLTSSGTGGEPPQQHNPEE
jgi:3-dehydroquinate dehydratase-2